MLRASRGFSRSSGLILGRSWGMGHISDYRRMTGPSWDAFPRLYALAPNPTASVLTMWTLFLPQASYDQRVADFMSLHIHLANLRPSAEAQDAWLWRHSRFSAKAIYHLLRGQAPREANSLVRRCRVVWKQRLPLKIRLFGWLLLRRRLMTRVIRRRMVPRAIVSCPHCVGEDEDCSHLFFTCPLAQEAWKAAGVAWLVASSNETF